MRQAIGAEVSVGVALRRTDELVHCGLMCGSVVHPSSDVAAPVVPRVPVPKIRTVLSLGEINSYQVLYIHREFHKGLGSTAYVSVIESPGALGLEATQGYIADYDVPVADEHATDGQVGRMDGYDAPLDQLHEGGPGQFRAHVHARMMTAGTDTMLRIQADKEVEALAKATHQDLHKVS
ncbi:hypothetical protein [Streptomyces sp. H39-C1]|uniref:hypothetical protein n=1 Tax=Streptomyces sp. H39-C1 TaxID=3004355 RepID=UPI0022AF904A|nr:hypothetical protein [Streptomyces sp. H39-C1]MCZ4101096.1 hypothetical protein [Streptomyces sp. H39-C1]